MPRAYPLVFAALCSTTVLGAQADPVLASRAEYAEAVKAYTGHDYASFLEHARRAEELRPDHGGVIYGLASAYALTGNDTMAVETLRRFFDLGYSADIAADSDLAGLARAPGYARLLAALAANRTPVVHSRIAFELPERDLLTEGIAHDPRTGTFYVGSVHHRKIVRIDRAGRIDDFVTLVGDSLGAPLGLKVDSARHALWVSVTAVPQMLGYDSAATARSGLVRYDLQTGTQTGIYLVAPDGVGHALGDVTIARDGTAYATDSRAPIVWRVPPGGHGIEPLLTSPLLLSGQGLALTPDERTLYVADYSRGILAIDLASRAIHLIPAAPGVLTLGIDGLYLADGRLIGVQNGVEPHRVVRLTLSRAGDGIVAGEVLERLHPRYAEPTLGVVVGRDFYYVANSQWERFGETGEPARPEALQRPVILRLRL